MGMSLNSPLLICSSSNELNVQYCPNPTFLRGKMHRLLNAVERRVESLFVGQINQPEIAVRRVATKARTMDHEHARSFQQINRKLFVGAAVEIVSLDHQIKRGLRHDATQTVDSVNARGCQIATPFDLAQELGDVIAAAFERRRDGVLRGRRRTQTTTGE